MGEPFERRLIERAVGAVRELVPTQGELVVVHQDFHGGNVLRAERKPWLAIDPKPLVGERPFDAASLLRDRREELIQDPAAGRRIRRRLDQLTAELGLDRERLRGWGIVRLGMGVLGQDAQGGAGHDRVRPLAGERLNGLHGLAQKPPRDDAMRQPMARS